VFIPLRDFFITLFFVALGMGIPNPLENLGVLAMAGVASAFLILSRFLAIYPLLHVCAMATVSVCSRPSIYRR
jgi:hypothetical protein